MINNLTQLVTDAYKAGLSKEQISYFIKAQYVPQPKQLKVHAACIKPTINIVGAGGSRGQAKSHAFVCQAWLYDMQKYSGLKVLYLRKIKGKANESMNDLRRKVLHSTAHTYSNNTLTFSNGSTCTFGGYRSENEIDNYLGIEYDLIIIEDAPTLKSDKITVIRASLRSARTDGWIPKLYMSGNPAGVGHFWFTDLFLSGKHKNTEFIHFLLGDNVFINKEYEDYLKSLKGWMHQAWALGDFNIAAGKFFKEFKESTHVYKHEDFIIPHSWEFWSGFDYGYGHYTTCYAMAYSPTNVLYVLDEYTARYKNVYNNAMGIHAMLHDNGIEEYLSIYYAGHDVFASKSDGYTIADEYAEHGIFLSRANTSRITGASKILSLVGTPKLQISDRCSMLIEQLNYLVHDPKRPSDVLKQDCNEQGENGDDAYDAFRYGVMSETIPMQKELIELLDNHRG